MASFSKIVFFVALLSLAIQPRAQVVYQQNLVNMVSGGTGHGSGAFVQNASGQVAHAFFFQIQTGPCVANPQFAFYLGGQLSNYFFVQNCDGPWVGDGQYHWTMYDFGGNSPCGGVAGTCNTFNLGDWQANNYFILGWSGGAYLDPSGNITPALILQLDTSTPAIPRGLPITVSQAETLLLQDNTTIWSGGAGYNPVFSPMTLNPSTTAYHAGASFQIGKVHIGTNADSSLNNHDGIGNVAASISDINGNLLATSTNTCYAEGGCSGADLWFTSTTEIPPDFSLTFATVDGAQGDSGFNLSQVSIYAEDPHPSLGQLSQLGPDGATPIPPGGNIGGTQVAMQTIPQSASSDPLILQVELQPLGSGFINIPTASSPPVSQGHSTSLLISALAPGSYHWQARSVDLFNLIASPWMSFGTGNTSDFNLLGGIFGPPSVTVSPNPVVFPLTAATQCTLPVTEQVTVTNTGGSTLTFSQDPQISGLDSFDFTLSNVPQTNVPICSKGTSLSPSNSCFVGLTFTAYKPCQPFAEQATLTFVDNASEGSQPILLSGGAPFSAILPNPVTTPAASQPVQIVGTGILSGAKVLAADLRSPKSTETMTVGMVSPSDAAIGSINFPTSSTSTWAITVINPDGTNPSPRPNDPNSETAIKAANAALMTNPFYFQVLGPTTSATPLYQDFYPFQNATLCPTNMGNAGQPPCPGYSVDPYGFPFRECTSYVAWRMNSDEGVTNPITQSSLFHEGLGGLHWGSAQNWATTAGKLGYDVFTESKPGTSGGPQRGDIAQWTKNNHVAYVEMVSPTGAIDISEFNFPEDHTFTTRTLSPSSPASTNGSFPDHFIRLRTMVAQPTSVTFPNTEVGASVSSQITITNSSTQGPITIASISTGSNNHDFGTADTCRVSTIAPQETCQITVTFTPSKVGTRTANLTIIGEAGTQVIPLLGAATPRLQ